MLFQCRGRLQTICSSCLFGSLLFAVLDPSLKLPNSVFPSVHETPAPHNVLLGSWCASGLLPLLVLCLTLGEYFSMLQDPEQCLRRGEPQPGVMFGLGADTGSSGTVCTPRTAPSA